MSPATGVFFRCLFGLPILLLVARAEWRTLGPMSRRTIGLSILAGVVFAVDLITFHYAVDLIGAGLGTVMGNLQVLIVGLAAWALFGERLRREVVVALPIMLVGRRADLGHRGIRRLRLESAAGRPDRPRDGRGVLRLPAGDPPGQPGPPARRARRDRHGRDGAPRRAVRGRCRVTWTSRPGLPALAYLLALGVLSQSVGYLFIQVSLPRLPAVITSVLLLVQPVATMILGAILLAELPSPWQLAGVGLVLGGMALATGAPGRVRAAMAARAAAA